MSFCPGGTMWLRIKLPGMQLGLVDANTIVGWEIDVDNYGEYALTAITPTSTVQFMLGTSDECHAMLNDILGRLEVNIIDVNDLGI